MAVNQSRKSSKETVAKVLSRLEAAKRRKIRERPELAANYRNAIVTFIDILGFRNIVSSKPADEIRGIIRLLQAKLAGDDQSFSKNNLSDMNWTRALYFSDSVVHIRPFDADYAEGAFFYQIHQLLLAQFELAGRGIFIRGGLTIGPIYHEAGALFGPAMVRAYDLESKYANYPRIIVDPKAVEQYQSDPRLRSHIHTLSQDSEFVDGMLRRGEDGLYFIDYLGKARYEMDYPENFPGFLRNLKQTIVKSAAEAKGNLAVIQKYLWLARYVNSVAAKYRDCARRTTIILGPKDIPELQTVLVPRNRPSRARRN